METDTMDVALDENRRQRFFRPLDWSAFWTACLLAFGVYFVTLAPTVTLEDSGELAVAGDYLGVPHPPGYPIWSLMAWIFTKVFFFVPFRGQPNPAWAIGLMSAVFGALASGITALLICRSSATIMRESEETAHAASRGTDNVICWISGVVCSLLFAFSPVMWSQSVIVEVYSLNAFFLVLVFLLVYMWLRRPSDPILFVTAFVFGLGLTNYQVLLLAGLALGIAVAVRDLDLFRDFVIAGAPYLAVLFLIQTGTLEGIRHPLHWSCAFYMSLNLLVLLLAFFFLPRGKTVAITFLLLELGVAFYAYMPIVSDLRNPPMNWGYPRTWEGFKHAITRGQYEKLKPSNIFSLYFVHQVGAYLQDLRGQFTLLAAPLGFLPFTTWSVKVGRRRYYALYATVALTAVAVAMAMVHRFLTNDAAFFAYLYKLLFCGVLGLLAVGGLMLLLGQATRFFKILTGRVEASISDRVMAGLVLAGAVGVFGLYLMAMAGNIAAVTEPLRAAGQISGERLNTIFLKTVGIVLLMILPPVLSALVLWLMHSRFELRMTIGERSQQWVIATLFGFLMMSLLLISLANLKLDIQDQFIQRVKFISSHALYAFWIGYGLVFGLAMMDHLFRGNVVLRWLMFGGVLALPLVPLYENAVNRELIRRYGGAEQNGHDFGWQFGNYQLRGANAIRGELSPDEEPLPNPHFPEEMTRDAIFFGGTDPGRFVPTYMIYSARVREDVYLITQNALADNTYMSVMRDLYGDRIWIPAQPDSAQAFKTYVEEVQSGQRPRNAQLKIEGGRVQVSGALGVMEINGILARQIFDHNIYRHDFYVEESYVIRWMYPHLEPHGLIMKINEEANKQHLTPDVVRNDSDFWDWYTRRLMSNQKFLRDVVARKSFSKLRSAIGGLYANRGRLDHAENAFHEARLLYPLSPEANFRLVQEVLMRQRRIDEARRIMAEFAEQDPGNEKAPDFIRHLDGLRNLEARRIELEAVMNDGKLDLNAALELAHVYQQSRLVPQLLGLTSSLLKNESLPAVAAYRLAKILSEADRHGEAVTALDRCVAQLPAGTPPNIYLDMARMYAKGNRPDGVEQAMGKYLEQQPNDWKGWLDLASVQIGQRKTNEAMRALEQAVRVGGNEAVQVLQGDQRFQPYLQEILSRARSRISIPGLPDVPMR